MAYSNGGAAAQHKAALGSFDLAFVKKSNNAVGSLGQLAPTAMPTSLPAVAVPTPTGMPTPGAPGDVAEAMPSATPTPSATPGIPAVPHSPEETALFNAEEALRAAANRKAAYEAAWHLARKAAEAAAAETAAKHAEYERLNSALKEAEKEARQATDDLRDSTQLTQSAAEKAEASLMEAATIKAEKKALAAHAKLDDDNSVARIAQHTKQLNFLKAEEERLRELSVKADKFHEEKEQAARDASLDAINAKTAAKKAKEVGMESTQAGQARAAKIALLSARSKQAEANLLQAAYMASEAAAKLAAGQRMVAEQQETLNDELALEKLLAAKSRKAEQDFIDATSKHAARETQTAAEGRKAEIDLFTAAVKDADHTATYETAKRVVDRAQEIAELKYKAEVKAADKARDLQEKYDIAKAAYEQAKAAVAIAEKKFTQSEDHMFEATKPSGEPADTVDPDRIVADSQPVFEEPSRRTTGGK